MKLIAIVIFLSNVSIVNAMPEIHFHAKDGRVEEVKKLLDNDPNLINSTTKSGDTPLHWAIRTRRKTVVNVLLEYGANVTAVNNYGNTCLHVAAENNRPELVELMLRKGADIHAKNMYGETPLHEAARTHSNEAIRTLLKAGANIKAKNNYGHTPKDKAVSSRRFYQESLNQDNTRDHLKKGILLYDTTIKILSHAEEDNAVEPRPSPQDTGQINVKMSDEVKEIASVADKWHEAWKNNDKKTFLELMRPEDPKLPDKMLELGKQLFAYLEDRPHKCLIVSRTEQKPSIATVHLYPISLPGRQIGFAIAMSKQDGKWYVLGAEGIKINELVTHYQRWADEYEKYEIWYDANAPEWLKPGQKESELAKEIAEINVKDRKLYQDSYGHLLADISKELLAGSRLQRSQLLKVIRKKGLSRLFDESFVEPLKACLKSEDVEVVKLARDMYGPLKRKVREKLETDASKIPHSPEEFKVLADTYRKKVNELDKALAKYRSKEIFSDFLDVLENEVFPLIHKGRIAGEQEGKIYRQDPNAFKKSAFDEEESKPAIIDICAAALKGIYEKFGRAVEEGDLRLPYDEQNKIFYWAGVQGFQSRQELIEKPYEEHCPFGQGTMEYYQFMDEVGQGCVMVSSPLMIMIKQLPEELEDAKEEVEIMYKWLEAGKGSRGEAEMPDLYKEPYLNEINELENKYEGLYKNKG